MKEKAVNQSNSKKKPGNRTGKRKGKNHYIGKYEHIFNHVWTEDEIKSLADELLSWMESATENMWFKDLLIEKRIVRARIMEFIEKSEYFAKVYSLCKELQESRMFKMGTSKKLNPAMFIMGLKNNHGWSDQQNIIVQDIPEIKISIKPNKEG